MNEKRFIFVCGLHRSGTSILHELLKSHPAVSGFANTGVPKDEGQLLQTVYPAAKEFGGPGHFGFNPESYMTEQHPLATKASADQLFREWGRHWDLSKEHLIEKSPPNLVQSRFLQALFPNSSFVVILRHPVAVAYATRSNFKRARTLSIAELVAHWIGCHKAFLADLPCLRRACVFRYEDFVRDSGRYLDQIFHLLGLPASRPALKISSQENEKYFELWRHRTAGELVDIEKSEPQVNVFGYSLRDWQSLPPVCLAGHSIPPFSKAASENPWGHGFSGAH